MLWGKGGYLFAASISVVTGTRVLRSHDASCGCWRVGRSVYFYYMLNKQLYLLDQFSKP